MDSSSGIVSAFSFRSFKVDKAQFEMIQELSVLELSSYQEYEWDFNIQIRRILYFSVLKIYVAGLDCNLRLYKKTITDRTPENAVFNLNIGCSGSFGVRDTRFETALENKIVKLQFPALLFTQLRAAISSLLASSGYGSVLLPLININGMFESKLDQIQIEERQA